MATLHLTNPNMTGATALQRALVGVGLLTEADVDDEYGPHTARAVEIVKARLGYPQSEIHPGHETADATLLAYLRGKKKLPPDYLERRKTRMGGDSKSPFSNHSSGEQTEQVQRAEVVGEFRWLIAHEPDVHYSHDRPIPVSLPRRTIPAGGISTDCSGAVTLACKWAGVPDPNGLGYSGGAFTGSMLGHLPHVSRRMVQPGDLVTFGPGTAEHVCMVLSTANADFELGSHGKERGPLSVPLSAEAAAHSAPAIFLALELN